jgi:hypothetical protein
MLEAIVKIGRPDGWWNRKVPIARISLVVGVLLAGLYVWGNYGDLIGNIVWGVRHQHTAIFRGQAIRVPWLWREDEWTNYNEFELTRASREPAFISRVTVTYENSAPGDVQEKVRIMRSQNARLSQVPGWYYGDYEGDDFSKAPYVCLNTGFKSLPNLIVNCLSRDGRWRVDMFGSKQTRSEFEMILHGVASMGNPAK